MARDTATVLRLQGTLPPATGLNRLLERQLAEARARGELDLVALLRCVSEQYDRI